MNVALDLAIFGSLFIERLSRHYYVQHLLTLYLSSFFPSLSKSLKKSSATSFSSFHQFLTIISSVASIYYFKKKIILIGN